jgi:6-phosphogluconate dehydrogenase
MTAEAAVLERPNLNEMSIVVLGGGKMGARMGGKLALEGCAVSLYDSSREVRERLAASDTGMHIADSLAEAIDAGGQSGERRVWQMLPAEDKSKGDRSVEDGPTETSLWTVAELLGEGDIVVDGGNSHWGDTERRAKRMGGIGLRYLGIGVSGGIIAEREGYPLMVGGDRSAYEDMTPILDGLALPNGGHHYFGEGGIGHLVKAGHNAAEYPLMQGIGEAFGIMKGSRPDLNMLEIAKLYQKGSLMAGFMMDRLVEALELDPELETFTGVIGSASGEAVWIALEADRLGLPAESIKQSIDFRRRSAEDETVSSTTAAKVVAALRLMFGGHEVQRTANPV